MGRGAASARIRERRAPQAVAAEAALSHPYRRTRSNGLLLRLDLGLGGCRRRWGDARSAHGRRPQVLSQRSQLPAGVRTLRRGLPLALSRGGGLHAPGIGSAGVHTLAGTLSAPEPPETRRLGGGTGG